MDGWRSASRHHPQSRMTVEAVLSFPRDTPEPLELSTLPSDTPPLFCLPPKTFIQIKAGR